MTNTEKKQLSKKDIDRMEYYTPLLQHLAPTCHWDFTLRSGYTELGLYIHLNPLVDSRSYRRIEYRLRIIRSDDITDKRRIGLIFEYREPQTEKSNETWTTDQRPWGLGQFPELTEAWSVKNSAFLSMGYKPDARIISEVIDGLNRLCTLGMLQPVNGLQCFDIIK